MSAPQPVLQHPFRCMCAELLDVADLLDAHNYPQAEPVRRVAYELRAIANGLDLTQGNSEANDYPQWSRDFALRVALDELAELLRRHREDA